MSVNASCERKNRSARGGRKLVALIGTSGGPFAITSRPLLAPSRMGWPVRSSKKRPARPLTSTPATAPASVVCAARGDTGRYSSATRAASPVADTGSKLHATATDRPCSGTRPIHVLNPAAPPECDTTTPPGVESTMSARA